MRYILPLIVICCLPLLTILGCKKKVNTPPKTSIDTIAKTPRDIYTPKMNGAWTFLGSGSIPGTGTHTVFCFYNINVLNDSEIIAYSGDTLKYLSTDTIAKTIQFQYETYNYNESITYNYSNGNIIDWIDFGYYPVGNGHLSVNTSAYMVNTRLKDYVAKMNGIRSWSGTHATQILWPPHDTVYNQTDTFGLTAVDDSTILCSVDFLNLGVDTLHYMSTDSIANTVIFQTYQKMDQPSSISVTYN